MLKETLLISMHGLDITFHVQIGLQPLSLLQNNIDLYETHGFRIVSAEPLLSLTPTPAPTPILTTGQSVGIAFGVLFFIILLTSLLIICVAW